MQQLASQPQHNPNLRPTNGGNSRSTIIVILALLLFSISGLLTGFATGAFTRPKQTQTAQNNKNTNTNAPTTVVPKQTIVPKTSPVVQVLPLGCPAINTFFTPEIADGAHPYTLSAFARDQSAGPCSDQNKRISTAGITFKMWLIRRLPKNKGLTFARDAVIDPANLAAPITAKIDNDDTPEIPGFTFSTPQVQQSNAEGNVTWSYTIAPTVAAGDYDLVVFVNWSGQHYNWTWRNIDIKKAG